MTCLLLANHSLYMCQISLPLWKAVSALQAKYLDWNGVVCLINDFKHLRFCVLHWEKLRDTFLNKNKTNTEF